MTSPHRRRSPGEGITGASTENDDNNAIVGPCDTEGESVAAGPRHRPHPDLCPHARPRHRYCRSCVRSRRRTGAELSSLCRNLSPVSEVAGPSSFGLDADRRRQVARELWADGWTAAEVESVVAVERRSA